MDSGREMVERVGEEMLEKVVRESLDDGMVDKMRRKFDQQWY